MGLGVDLGTCDVPICTDKFGNKNEVELAELDTSDVRISTEEVEDENEVELAELELSVLEDILEDILVMLLAKLVEECCYPRRHQVTVARECKQGLEFCYSTSY
jgi:hypothetical protein